jgi:hypothetical protein
MYPSFYVDSWNVSKIKMSVQKMGGEWNAKLLLLAVIFAQEHLGLVPYPPPSRKERLTDTGEDVSILHSLSIWVCIAFSVQQVDLPP